MVLTKEKGWVFRMELINTISFKSLGDERGSLVALEGNNFIPFDIKRVYYIFGTKEGVKRGFHAHKNLRQVAICVAGSCRFILDDGTKKEEIVLNSPATGLLIEGIVWREMHDFSSDCVLMVLADKYYDESDYIRKYDDFLGVVNEKL
jgi:dTDP-4-dehydrorhamnose 3,5-epimerase-like enzyme